jgi:hypothetical protein
MVRAPYLPHNRFSDDDVLQCMFSPPHSHCRIQLLGYVGVMPTQHHSHHTKLEVSLSPLVALALTTMQVVYPSSWSEIGVLEQAFHPLTTRLWVSEGW